MFRLSCRVVVGLLRRFVPLIKQPPRKKLVTAESGYDVSLAMYALYEAFSYLAAYTASRNFSLHAAFSLRVTVINDPFSSLAAKGLSEAVHRWFFSNSVASRRPRLLTPSPANRGWLKIGKLAENLVAVRRTIDKKVNPTKYIGYRWRKDEKPLSLRVPRSRMTLLTFFYILISLRYIDTDV